jgi:hypothetical protein
MFRQDNNSIIIIIIIIIEQVYLQLVTRNSKSLSPTNATLSTSKLKTQKRKLNLDRNLRLEVLREGEIYRWKQENKFRFKEKRA